MQSKPHSLYKRVLGYAIGLAIIAMMIGLVYKDFTWADVFREYNKLNLSWIGVIVIITIICHLVRAFRWKRLLNASGETPTLFGVAQAMMLGYFANIIFLRAGEVTRCFTLQKTDNTPVLKTAGSVFTERLSDLIFLFLFTFLAITFNYESIWPFVDEKFLIPAQEQLGPKFSSIAIKLLIAAFAIGGLLVMAFAKRIIAKLKGKLQVAATQIWRGITGILNGKFFFKFLLESVAIWVFYYFMTYLWFKAFEPGNHISMLQGFAIVAIGNLARTVPLQAGAAGVYHGAMLLVFVFYGMNETEGRFLALAIHALQTGFYLVFGLVFGVTYIIQLRRQDKDRLDV
ncbi:MAG: flippase-like domain-containing protein [Bacteroidetes bacterium]|nr:flippase-like domain-containing protein [Bacteroidota bacterium]